MSVSPKLDDMAVLLRQRKWTANELAEAMSLKKSTVRCYLYLLDVQSAVTDRGLGRGKGRGQSLYWLPAETT